MLSTSSDLYALYLCDPSTILLVPKKGRGMITLQHIFLKIFFYDNDPHQNDKCLLVCLCVSSAILECEYDSKPDPCPVHCIGGLEDPSLHGNDPHPDNLSCPEDKGKCRQHITSQKVIFLVNISGILVAAFLSSCGIWIKMSFASYLLTQKNLWPMDLQIIVQMNSHYWLHIYPSFQVACDPRIIPSSNILSDMAR